MKEELINLEDFELIKRAKEGNDLAEEILLSRMEPSVSFLVNKYMENSLNKELIDWDIVSQEGRIGIFKAIYSFDILGNASFKTYANTCIRNRIINEIKKESKNEVLDSLDETNDEGEEIIIVSDSTNLLDQVIYKEMLEKLYEKADQIFSENEKLILSYFLEDLSIKEISDKLSLTEKQVYNAKKRIKDKIIENIF